jgi:hypothetical protein
VDSSGFDSLQGQKIFFPKMFPPVLESARCSVGSGKRSFSLHVKRPRREVDLVRGLEISGAIHPLMACRGTLL